MNDLELSKEIITILKKNKIESIESLTNLERSDLKKLSLTNSQINQIIIKLQLNGFDLKKAKRSVK
ncbi:MAG: hypothetical protein IKP79_00025 [Bacilli bacterium]|nr:hypothetical protein [Bacilli bacterium]